MERMEGFLAARGRLMLAGEFERELPVVLRVDVKVIGSDERI